MAADGQGRARAGPRAAAWGRGPLEILATLRRREWDNAANLRDRLLGERPFPIRLTLGAPSGTQATTDLARFRDWMQAWQGFAQPDLIERERRQLHRLGEQDLPVALVMNSMQELATVLGSSALQRVAAWEPRLESLLALADAAHRPALFRALVQRIERVERLAPDTVRLLKQVVPQLAQGLGNGSYLRALPLNGVDTKFVEDHETLITAVLDVLHDGNVNAAGGLRAWLGSLDNPSGWLTVRALCDTARSALGGLPVLQLPMQHLTQTSLPASRILVVENLQSGLALPPMADTIAVVGAGRNLGWLSASWLDDRRVGYWGDIDSWGLQMLGEARELCPHLDALMMDLPTLEAHLERIVPEQENALVRCASLTNEERSLLDKLHADGCVWRLEQERLSADWVGAALARWMAE